MLRPISFKILSTTQLKIGFNLNLSSSIDADNFKIEAVSGSIADAEIISVFVDKNEVIINTRPHYAKAYYVLKLLDSNRSNFVSDKGIALINDDISRDIYFIGVDKVNQIRDDLFFKTPSIYSLDNTLVSSILGIHSDQVLNAQHSIGSVLNDNYISELVENEYRVRSSGATDRLSNENAFQIERVSLSPSGTNILNKIIEIESSDIYPINLKQEFVEMLSINNTISTASFSGFLITVPNQNIIKLTNLKLIKDSDVEDCDGNLGIVYDINKYKYSIKNNRYDQQNGFSNFELESNQILLSDFGNIPRPEPGDTVIISYYYQNDSISIIDSSIEVYETVDVINESIPSNSKYFSLKNSNIIDDFDSTPEIGGVFFKLNENSLDVPYQFSRELKFNFSSLPKNTGEYSVNYNTGDVYVVGENTGEGTGYNYFFANYRYKNVLKNNLDYNIYNSELNFNYLRPVFGKNIKISIDYEVVFAKNIDYKPMVHHEVLGENIKNNITSSFSLKTKFGPITDVFRIYNQTTGEIYSLNYFSNNDVYFTGNRLPTSTIVSSEISSFQFINGEEIIPSGKLLSPMHYAKITSNLSTNNIEFYPGIPAELINQLTTDYYIRFLDDKLDDCKIISFYAPNSNNLISGFSIQTGTTIPNVNSRIQIGPYLYFFNLKNNKILNKTNDGVGSLLNSSVYFDSNFFTKEKYFQPIGKNQEISIVNSGSQLYAVSDDQLGIVNNNLSRLRVFGDYSIDYGNGVLYAATPYNSYFGNIFYSCGNHVAQNKNIISVTNISKKISASDSNDLSITSYDYSFSDELISIQNLESTTNYYDGSSFVSPSGELVEKLIVKEDFTIKTDYNIASLRNINKLENLFGKNLDSIFLSDRIQESSSEELIKPITNGGKNYYLKGLVGFYENTIDLKGHSKSKISLIDGNLEIIFKTSNINSIYQIINKLENVILNQDLNFVTQDNLNINFISEIGLDQLQLSLENLSSLYSFNFGYDYIIYGQNRWKITSFDGINSIIINKYSENYGEIFSENECSLAIRPQVSYGQETRVIYPYNNFMNIGDTADISFISNDSLYPGDAVAIDYSYGSVFIDYAYLNDTIVIYYEYGDNEIDWSINNSIIEGQGYYVTYKYGALRSGLRKNFGRLTSIPFFDNQSYSIDREFYRDAVSGVLSSYPKGPTKEALSGLVKSITKTTPTIKELSFGSWILGRDYLSPSEISYKGSLEFIDGKFGSGLRIDDQNSLYMPAISNLSLSEGTFEAWITPDWHGINNDATLTFDFDNLGNKKYSYIGGDPFSTKSGYDVICSDCISESSGFDHSGNKLTIYKTPDVDGYSSYNYDSLFGIFNKKISLNRETKIKSEIEFSINYSYLPLGFESFNNLVSNGSFSSGAFLADFSHKLFMLSIAGETYKLDGSTVLFEDVESVKDAVLNFNPPYPTIGCSCYYPNQNNVLENFNNLEIEIKLDSPISNTDLFDLNFVSSFSPECLLIVDQDGRFYQVTGLRDYLGQKTKEQINYIYGFYVSRYPINYPSITSRGYEEINSISISNFIIIKKTIKLNLKEEEKSSEYFNSKISFLLDWNKKEKISYYIDPILNTSELIVKSGQYQFFYTDLIDTNLLSNFGTDVMQKSVGLGVFGITSLNIYKNIISVFFKFSQNDIYIGSSGTNPNRNTFSLNRRSDQINCNGISDLINNNDGIYIGYDSNCLSPINENVGQWVIRARFLKYSKVPYDVEIIDGDHTNLYEYVYIDNPIFGKVITDGTYSSVSHSRTTVGADCSDSLSCSLHLRFLGNKSLDSDGWSVIQSSDSEYIDSMVGGREAESIAWTKSGSFDSNNISGIYRINNISEADSFGRVGIYSPISCTEGDIEYNVSAKISSFNENILFTTMPSFDLLSSGIVILEIRNMKYIIGVLLSSDINKNPMVSLVDLEKNYIIKSEYFNWNNNNFNNYKLIINKQNSTVNVIINDIIIIQSDLSSILVSEIECIDNYPPGVAINLFSPDFNTFNSELMGDLVVDISTVEYNSKYVPGADKLEDGDILIVSDNIINFELHSNPNEIDGIEYDGYIQESDIDEIMITSDIERYILDSGIDSSNSRISIFKDGKGFLNFRIIDGSKENNSLYNLATSIKNFMPGERHHIAASWRLNSDVEKDEMHLFLDGQEAPNLFKFGGLIPTRFNSKFSDVAKEYLKNYYSSKIVFPEILDDGEVVAGSNLLYSSLSYSSLDLIGRTVLFSEIGEPDSGALVILEVGDGWLALGNIDTLEPYVFTSSGSNIKISLAPYANNIITDIENEKFSIFKKDCNSKEQELGGLEYILNNNTILIKNNPNYYQYRFNAGKGLIEFVFRNYDCRYVSSISTSDVDIHIKTYGLVGRRYFDVISISSSSIYNDDPAESLGLPTNRNGYSIIMTTGPRPKNLSDVSIRKYILYNHSIVEDSISDSIADFSINLSEYTLSSSSISSSKINDGRYLELKIDSDNIRYSEVNTIKISGETTSGYAEELLTINKNGSFYTANRYISLYEVSGSLNIIDSDMQFIGMINIIERNSIFTQDGSGSYAKIYSFSNGYFVLSSSEHESYYPFELLPGYYEIDYSSHLKISLPRVGHKLYVGSSFEEKNQLSGIIDEAVILSTMLRDLRPWESSNSVTRTITGDFFRTNPTCISNSTLVLIDFENPINKQSRRLRNKRFLSLDNYSYGLSVSQIEKLIQYINDEENFIFEMMSMGFSKDDAVETYIECHKADGNPILNLAKFIPTYNNYKLNENSVNSFFSQAIKFDKKSSIFLSNNNNIVRNSGGTIEFWYSPSLDSFNNNIKTTFFESTSVQTERVTSLTPFLLRLSNSASKVLSIRLISSKKLSDSEFYSQNETSKILFDEIITKETTGRNSGGTGTEKDFSYGHNISYDNKTINLADSLPGSNVDVIVTYIPKHLSDERIEIFKDEFSRVVARIEDKEYAYSIPVEVSWSENSWHRISFTYKTSKDVSFMKLFIDGILYSTTYKTEKGKTELEYNQSDIVSNPKIILKENSSIITIGNNHLLNSSALGLMDNLRISRLPRAYSVGSSGEEYDFNYSSNVSSILPVQSDDLTTYIQNFNKESVDRDVYTATIVDPKYGIFDFEVLISDDFNRVVGIDGGKLEDILSDLIMRIKPAHSNGYVKYIEKKCIE